MDMFTAVLWRNGKIRLLLAAMTQWVLLTGVPPAAEASRHPETTIAPGSALSPSVRWAAPAGCLNSQLRRIVTEVAASFGPVTVNSTCRSKHHNARVGGAGHSYHIGGNAADFTVKGNVRRALAFLGSQRSVGGLKHYRDGHFHIDTGPRRSW